MTTPDSVTDKRKHIRKRAKHLKSHKFGKNTAGHQQKLQEDQHCGKRCQS